MKLKVSIDYKTMWGESLQLCLGSEVYALTYAPGGMWIGDFDEVALEGIDEYHYELVRDGHVVRREWRSHLLELPSKDAEIILRDRWNDRGDDAPFYSSAFTKGIFGRTPSKRKAFAKTANVLMRVSMPVLRSDEVLGIAGDGKALGGWDHPIPFLEYDFPEWVLPLKVDSTFSYKFVILKKDSLEPVLWENHENRFFTDVPSKGEFIVEADCKPAFQERRWRGAGTAIPVFSLRTEDDFGVGEFYDLKKFVDWAAMTGQSVIQILPINDTTMTGTWKDSYPYNANSIFALHPQFINLPAAGVTMTKELKKIQAELNSLDRVDYERVNNLKLELLHKAFDKAFAKLSVKREYQDFVERNASWLLPYAAFCSLRDAKGTADFSKWGSFKTFVQSKVNKYIAEHRSEVDFWCFVQYHLDKQLSEVRDYAHAHGVVLKGDLPIGISRTSVDAWVHPELFHMDSQAGAPPDAFSATGQNWGFPTYNWEKMAEDGYAWWKARMAKMSEYFDVFRIDHILGFFRIWEIPVGSESGLDGYFNPALPYSAHELRERGFNPEDGGLFLQDARKEGMYHPRIAAHYSDSYRYLDGGRQHAFNELYNDFFYRRHNQFWKERAMEKLPALLDSTNMLACGEDLGMIPATVPEVMSELKILSLEIQRMPKNPEDTFADPAYYPYLSVCTTSTHDMNPIRAWWEEDRAMTERFFREVLHCGWDAPQFCEPWVCRRILDKHLYSPAMLTILPLQDWMSMDATVRLEGEKWVETDKDRINVPANPRHYWRYRMHITIEDLMSREVFNENIKQMIQDSGRC